jgi:hypothetical protein
MSVFGLKRREKNTKGSRYPKRQKVSTVQTPPRRSFTLPLTSEDDGNDSEDDEDDVDDADYEHDKDYCDDRALSPPSTGESDEGMIQNGCEDEKVDLEMFIPVLLPRKYLCYLLPQRTEHSALTRDNSRMAKRNLAPVQGTRRRFTTDDDKLLLELRERDLSWQVIHEHYFPARSTNSLQVHYCTKLSQTRR